MGAPSTRTRHKTAKPATANRPETQLQAQADTYVMLGTAWCSTPANIPAQQPRANDTQRATETPSRDSLEPVCSTMSFCDEIHGLDVVSEEHGVCPVHRERK